MTSEDAALAAGISQPVGTRLFRQAGGMAPAMFKSPTKPPSGRYLSFAEREEIALLRVQGLPRREIGRRLGRSASTISRELRRNAATRSGGLEYRASTAQWHADRSARRPKPAKLPSIQPCAHMCRSDWPAPSQPRPGLSFLVLPFRGRAAGMAGERIGDGPGPGVRSRLHDACRSISRTTRACALATKPSIKRSLFRVGVRYAVN